MQPATMQPATMHQLIDEASHAVGVELTELQIQQFTRYAELLMEWNQKFNLTAIANPEGIATKHFADSLTLVPVLTRLAAEHAEPITSVLDLGTGAGFPGLPLKIALPNLHVTLMDSTGKKVLFCQTVIDTLKLSDIRALNGRAEEAAHSPQHRERYDLVVARAVAPLATLVEYLLPFVRVGGLCIAMKGSDAEAELSQAQGAVAKLGGAVLALHTIQLPSTQDKRAFIAIQKNSSTKTQYPRQGGAPRNKPLR